MAIADPAHYADDCCELAKTQLRLNRLLSSPAKLLTIFVVILAIGLGGCARHPAYRELSLDHRELNPVRREVRTTLVRPPSRVRVHAESHQDAELRVRRPDPALLTPQPAPNCEFKRADLRTVDGDEWARLKTEYERQCYQDAEKAARDRLSQLQASSTCELERVSQQTTRSVTSARSQPRSR